MGRLTVDVGIKKQTHNVVVDVILLSHGGRTLEIMEDETSPVREIPKEGIKISNRRGAYASLSMTERRAVNLNLI